MADSGTPIDRDEYSQRIADLCARGGRHAFPRRARDRAILLHALARSFAGAPGCPRRTSTARIQSWLLQTGRALETDHVALRRALMDDGYLERAPDGAAYGRARITRAGLAVRAGVADVDPDAVVADAQARTAERKRQRGESGSTSATHDATRDEGRERDARRESSPYPFLAS